MAEIDAGRGVADPKDPDGPKDCVWLDMTGIDPERMKEVLPQVVETIEQYAEPRSGHATYVPVKPTAHYTMGGIPITTDGEVYRWADGDRAGRRWSVRRWRMLLCLRTWCESSGRQFSARRLPVRHTRWSDDGRTHRREPG